MLAFLRTIVIAVVAILAHAEAVEGQVNVDSLLQVLEARLATQDSIKDANRRFGFGLSIGLRTIPEAGKSGVLLDAAINPVDSTLIFDTRDKHDITLSGVVTVFPWARRTKKNIVDKVVRGFGFIVNVNIANFAQQSVGVFNQRIEGGGGLTYRLCREMALAATYERVAARRLRSAYDVFINKPLLIDGKPLTNIDISDNRFFVDDYLAAWSIKYVFFF
jgi:hypothetical protein